MPEEKEDQKNNSPGFTVNLEKLLPYFLIAGSWLVNYGRNDSNTVILKQQVDAETTIVTKLSDDLKTLTIQVAHLDQTIEDQNRQAIQDRNYRESIGKNK